MLWLVLGVIISVVILILNFFIRKGSQLGADRWVLDETHHRPGIFLDVGAGDGEILSNTFLLEKKGWQGICIDPFPKNFKNRPNSIIHKGVVWNKADMEVNFVYNRYMPVFSGVERALGQHKALAKLGSTTETFKTETVGDILDRYGAPHVIDFMSLDIEGGELEVLQTFPFERYRVNYISVEHNYEKSKRSQIKRLLESKGYQRVRKVKWDDWYRFEQ